MKYLILIFDAPLMSFGAVIVDHYGPTDRFPGQAMLTGLLGNALGWRHGDAVALQALQDRIVFAARWDLPPVPMRDYHTVDLGQSKMTGYATAADKGAPGGWTTRGSPEHRTGEARFGTYQREMNYWANGIMTVSLGLTGDGDPSVNDLAQALRTPARPLFIGRKTCIPATPILREIKEAPDVLSALRMVPRERRPGIGPKPAPDMEACWPDHLHLSSAPKAHRVVTVYDRRDWRAQTMVGRRVRCEGLITEEPR